MKKNIKPILWVGAALLVTAVFIVLIIGRAAGNLDVVGRQSTLAFERLVGKATNLISKQENGWRLSAPDGSAQLDLRETASETGPEAYLSIDLAPFTAAGMDAAKLSPHYEVLENRLLLGMQVEKEYAANNPLEAYNILLSHHRAHIGYDTGMDHFHIEFGHGNMFEWAKNLETHSGTGKAQEMDMVFVLDPEPLVQAGLNPNNVEGWQYKKVTMGGHGKTMEAWKLLKAIDIH